MPVTINGNGTVTGLTALPDSAMSSGSIIQVVQTFKTDAFSASSSSYVDITGMSVDITPSSNSNKILLEVLLNVGGANNMYGGVKLMRGSTAVGISTAVSLSNQVNASFGVYTENGSNTDLKTGTFGFKFLDSPTTTSATTYKLQVYTRNGVEFNLNKANNNGNEPFIVGSTSSITVMEIAA